MKASDPANGILALGQNGSFTYTPNANFAGTDAFTYKASDGQADSAAATVTITVKDTTKPRVSTATPTGRGVVRNTNLKVTFSEKMDPATLTGSTFKLF